MVTEPPTQPATTTAVPIDPAWWPCLLVGAFVVLMWAHPAAARRNTGGHVHGWYLTPEEVSEKADVVARIQVEAVGTSWWRDAVWTEARCQVREVWKGSDVPAEILVRQAGGRLGEFTTEAGPVAPFVPGDEWVVAANRMRDQEAWTLIGMTQGAFLIEDNVAVRDYSGFAFIRPVPAGILADRRESLGLEELCRRMATPANLPRLLPQARQESGLQADSTSPAKPEDAIAASVPEGAEQALAPEVKPAGEMVAAMPSATESERPIARRWDLGRVAVRLILALLLLLLLWIVIVYGARGRKNG